jgi:hypothetical protein
LLGALAPFQDQLNWELSSDCLILLSHFIYAEVELLGRLSIAC